MKAALLLALRATTGLLLVIWGVLKIAEPDHAIRISDKLYAKAISAAALQTPLGIAEIILGVLVVLGLARRVVYPAQALILCFGGLALWKYLLDPLGYWLLTAETRNYLFFPSSTIAVASLIMLAFREYDTLALDRVLFHRRRALLSR